MGVHASLGMHYVGVIRKQNFRETFWGRAREQREIKNINLEWIKREKPSKCIMVWFVKKYCNGLIFSDFLHACKSRLTPLTLELWWEAGFKRKDSDVGCFMKRTHRITKLLNIQHSSLLNTNHRMLYCLMFISKWYPENAAKVNALTCLQSSVKSQGLSSNLEYIKRSLTELKIKIASMMHMHSPTFCYYIQGAHY